LQAPRAEAVSILGSLLSFPSNLTKVPYLKPDCHQFVITYCPDIKVSLNNTLNYVEYKLCYYVIL